MKQRKYYILSMMFLLLWGSIMPMYADDNYDPTLPAEPNAYFKLTTTSVDMQGNALSCYTSGGGYFQEGATTTVSCSSSSTNYTFAYWIMPDGTHNTNQRFTYTMPNSSVKLKACFEYTPSTPAEPNPAIAKYRLYLGSNLEGACSFNITSGKKYETESYVSVSVYANQGYVFEGWYVGAEKVSSATSFSYLIQNSDVTLTAHFTYAPLLPGEPNRDESKYKVGDVNEDGVVNAMDAVALIGYYLQGDTEKLDKHISDANNDNTINTMDAIEIINIYLNNK